MASKVAGQLRDLDLPGLKKLTDAELAELRWETKQNIFTSLLSEMSSSDAGERLGELVKERREKRRAEKERERSGRIDDLGSLPEEARRQEDEFRSRFLDVVAKDCQRLGAPRGLTSSTSLNKTSQCLQLIEFLVTRHTSRLKTRASYTNRVSTQHQRASSRTRPINRGQHTMPRDMLRLSPSTTETSGVWSLPSTRTSDTRSISHDIGCGEWGSSSGSSVPTSSGGRAHHHSLSAPTLHRRRRPLGSSNSSSTPRSLEARPQWVSTLGTDESSPSPDTTLDHGTEVDMSSSATCAKIAAAPMAAAAAPSVTADSERAANRHTDDGTSPEVSSDADEAMYSGPITEEYECDAAKIEITRSREPHGVVADGLDKRSASSSKAEWSSAQRDVQRLRAENDRLKAELREMKDLYDGLTAGPKGGSVDERRVMMLQAHNLQLQRQVDGLQMAADAAQDLEGHLSALLCSLQANVEEIVQIGHPGATPTVAAAATGTATKPTTMKVGTDFWTGVLNEIKLLGQKWAEVQRLNRVAACSRTMLPPEARAFLRRPSDLVHPSRDNMSCRPTNCDVNDSAEPAGGRLHEGGMVLDRERLFGIANDLSDLVKALDLTMEALIKDPVLVGQRAGRFQQVDALEGGLQGLLDSAKALLLSIGGLSLVMPSSHSQLQPASKEREVIEGFGELTARVLGPAEVSAKASALKQAVVAERRALARALVVATEENVMWRAESQRHRSLLHKLAESMNTLWRECEAEVSGGAEAIDGILTSLEKLDGTDDGDRAAKGQLGPHIASFVRTAVERYDELLGLRGVLEGTRRKRVSENGQAASVWERSRLRLEKLWDAYRKSWEVLCDAATCDDGSRTET